MNRNRTSALSEQLKALGSEVASAFSVDHLDVVNRLQLYDELSPAAYNEIGRALREVKKLTREIPSEELLSLVEASLRVMREVESAAAEDEEILISRFRTTQRGYSLQKILTLMKRELSACGLDKEQLKPILERIVYAQRVLDQLISILN